ncbi:MAG TPA: glycosyltransferase family 4 protein [Thermoanaerobaculia bacterium]|nr:glycosyltransferase family 4 protein [Thermoanaerobaculia bacterium]
MNLAFVVERPTQFEVPFYRHAAADSAHRLRVLYTDPRGAAPAFDPELGRTVSWGIDLIGGYEHASCPDAGALQRELRQSRYDLVLVNGYTRRLYVLAAALARGDGTPVALRLDSALFETPPPRALAKRLLFELYLKRMYRLFFGVGSLTLDYLRYFGVPEERMALFPYAVDVDAFRRGADLSPVQRAMARARLGIPGDARVLLSVAKLNPREAPWDLLRAYARRFDSDRWVVVAGDGPERPALEGFAHERGLERVLFLGYVPYPELPALYATSDLFLHPVREERWGVSVQEALACGLPAITSSRVGAARDLIAAGKNGATYAAGDDAELARRIDEVLRLDPAAIREENRRILTGWDYTAAWRGILRAASRLTGERLTEERSTGERL